jgi:hypothetical protein
MASLPEHKRLIDRLYKTQDGKDFIEEYIKELQKTNYIQILASLPDNRAELVGYGNCLKDIVKVFRTSSE